VLQFDGICVLTHNATNFDLGSAGVNITTAAGEVYTFYEYASADWRLVSRSTIAPAVTFPAGIIILWSGAISAIPSGWVICDGNNSTPNLTARFVIHASADSGATYDVNDTGGSTTSGTHQLTIAEMPAHTHTGTWAPTAGADDGSGSPSPSSVSLQTTSSTGGDGTHAHANTLPPYYALAYIMKS
jgi:microcystin-dependent protein